MNWTTKNCFAKTFASGIQRKLTDFDAKHFQNILKIFNGKQWDKLPQSEQWTLEVCERCGGLSKWYAFDWLLYAKGTETIKKIVKISPWKFSEEKSKKNHFKCFDVHQTSLPLQFKPFRWDWSACSQASHSKWMEQIEINHWSIVEIPANALKPHRHNYQYLKCSLIYAVVQYLSTSINVSSFRQIYPII